jgi:hypothetical protein
MASMGSRTLARRRWADIQVVMVTLAGLIGLAPPLAAQTSFLENGSGGFVVSDIRFALAEDAAKTGACPRGMSLNVSEIYAKSPEGKRRKGETDEEYTKRLDEGGKKVSTAPNGQNLCMNPEAGGPDPNFRTVSADNIPVDGIDLDGEVRPHHDFTGPRGERGVDNQFYRVVGCTRSWQSAGSANSFAIEMLTGSWGILITLSGVDDLKNDDEVEVGVYSNADPIVLSPARAPLSYATYAMEQDPRFRAKTRGRIKDGVLTTDPVDVRFHWIVNSLRLERPLRHARFQLTVSQDGTLSGYLGGYTPVEAMYDMAYGYRNGKNGAGQLAPLPLRFGTANGAARVLGHTCQGAYYALQEYADGDLDPRTGRYTSISTQYRITAIPAFVVDVATQSSNAKLVEKAKLHEK